jgi:hypothetical protein
MKWKENCQRWFSNFLIQVTIDANFQNIKELNKILGYYDKRLAEYETILSLDQGRNIDPSNTRDSQLSLITLDELFTYQKIVKKGGEYWIPKHGI